MLTSSVKADSPFAGQVGTKFDNGCVFALSGGELVGTANLQRSHSRCESGTEYAASDGETVPFVSNPRQEMGVVSSSKYCGDLARLYKKWKPVIYVLAFLAGWACYGGRIRHAERSQSGMLKPLKNQGKTGQK